MPISDVVDSHFNTNVGQKYDAAVALSQLDIGLMQAGKMAQVIFYQVVDPNGKMDEEAVAALTLGLLTFLGRLGGIVVGMEDYVRALPADHSASA